MNTGTRDPKLAGERAQALANANQTPYVVFFPATGVGGPLHIDSMPSWWYNPDGSWSEDKAQEWKRLKESQGATVYWPARAEGNGEK